MPAWRNSRSPRDSNQIASGVTGAVQYPSGTVVGDRSKTCNEMAIDTGIFVTGFDKDAYGTLFASKNFRDPLCYLHTENMDDFVEFLKLFHENNSCSRKDANWLISPAIFDPTTIEGTKRGLNNIVTVRNLWMDFEKGQLQPDEFPDLFPKTKLLVFNTYSHTSENPRFRVVFPFDAQLSPDEYCLLYDQLIAKIVDAGYEVGRRMRRAPSGLDISKRTPSSLFYLPCQAKEPSESFFHDHYHDKRRTMLDPTKWIEHSVVVVPFPKTSVEQDSELSPPATIDQTKVDEATVIWRQSVNHPGEGNERFWNYASALRSAGLSLDQIEQTLQAEAIYGRNPSERRDQIPSIMKSLRRSWKKAGSGYSVEAVYEMENWMPTLSAIRKNILTVHLSGPGPMQVSWGHATPKMNRSAKDGARSMDRGGCHAQSQARRENRWW